MKIFFFFIFLLLLAVPIISSVQPSVTQINVNIETGINIQYPALRTLRQSQDYTFEFHVFNISTGLLLNNATTSCLSHLSNRNGNKIVNEPLLMAENLIDFYIFVDGGNFTDLGAYTYMIYCNESSIGGFASVPFEVTADGFPARVFPIEFIFIILGILFIIVGLMKKRLRLFKHMGSLLLMIMGVLTLFPGYSFINWTTLMGKSLGAILIAIGFYFAIESSFSSGEEQSERYDQYFDEEDKE